MNIIMISADVSVVAGDKGPFYYMLEEFHRHFDRIDVIGLKPARVEKEVVFGNVHLNHPDRGKLFQPLFIRQTGKRLLSERPYAFAVSHDYNFFYNGIGAYLLKRRSGLPYISEIHHVPGHPLAASFREKVDRFFTRRYVRWVQNHALAIRVVNGLELPGLLKGWGVRPDRIRVLHSLYIDFNTYHPSSTEKTHDLIFCGRLVKNKGLFILLEALKIMKQERPGIRLLIVGKGPLKEKIHGFVSQAGLRENVEFIEWVSEASDLAELYRRARILVCASYNEGGPRVTVEAMACGTPALSTPVGIMPELIEEDLLFHWDARELAAKAGRLLSDEQLHSSIAGRQAEAVAPFERRKVIAGLAGGFKALLPPS